MGVLFLPAMVDRFRHEDSFMKISIRIALISVILGLIWVTYALTTSTTYLSSQKTLHQHAQDIMQNIARLAMQEAFTHLNHAQDATVLTKRLLSDEIVSGDRETAQALEQYFYNNMVINPHFAGIYLGTPDGSFYDVRRHEKMVKNGFRTKIIAIDAAGARQTRLVWRDPTFQLIEVEAYPGDTYDPRTRPWYEKALKERKIVWTDPYIFYSSRKPGITIAGPFFDKEGRLNGVIGVDIEIDQLSTFIAGLKVGKTGRAFMVNRLGDVVAHPNLDKLRWGQSDGDPYRLVKIDELNDPLSRNAFDALARDFDLNQMDRPKLAKFTFQGKAHTAMIAPFNSWQWPWFICVYLPEDDYLGELKANRLLNMVLTFCISLLATAIGLYLARGIVRPISALESEATSIKESNFDSEKMIASPYKEIRATAQSFQSMKEELGRHRKNLEDQVRFRTRDLERINIELSREIEQRQTITEALEKREKAYFNLYNLNRMVTNNVPDLIWAKDLESRYIFANQAICEKLLMCANPEAAFGKSDTYFADRERRMGYTHTFGEICENSDEITLRKKAAGRFLEDGLVRDEYLALDVYKAPFINENGEIIGTVGCGRDVTKEKAIEKELQSTEERFREMFEKTSDMIYSVDRENRLLMVNKAWSKTLKYDTGEMIGRNLFQVIHADNHPNCRRFYERVFRGEALENIETTFVAKDGILVHAVGSLTPRGAEGEIVAAQAIFHNITDRKENEKAILDAHAQLERRVENRTAALTEANDLLRIKIAESKQAEERRKQAYEELQSTQAQLVQAAKLASIGELASGVAHELNQPLMVIRGNAQLIRKSLDTPADPAAALRESVHLIERNTKRMMNTINHLRSFSRQSRMEFDEVNINAVLTEALMMIGEQLRLHRVVVHTQFDPDLPIITGDANQLEQTLLNLLTNARDAIEKKKAQTSAATNGGDDLQHSITIRTGRVAGKEDSVEVLVEDSGCGILPEHVPKVFDPFFTTKEVGQGTGLGLSISYGIIQDHGGSIAIARTGLDGTVFRVRLPADRGKS
jgi:PAS domain S-box-containing protein